MNTYAYVSGNPISIIDPTGEFGVIGFIGSAAFEVGVQMLVKDRSFSEINWGTVAIAGAIGTFAPGFISYGRAMAQPAFLATKFAGLTKRDLTVIQGLSTTVAGLLKAGHESRPKDCKKVK